MRKLAGVPWLLWVILVGVTALAGAFYYLYVDTRKQYERLSGDIRSLAEELAATTTLLALNLAETKEHAAGLSDTLAKEQERVTNISSAVGGVESQVGKIAGSVGTLEKLAKTDPELLQKYSKVFFLNEHYTPERLVEIPKTYLYTESRPEKIHSLVWPHLQALFDDAKAAGVTIYVKSAFRSFNEQSALKNSYTVTYGAGTANAFSADQGYSEHQLGTTLDLITPGLGGKLDGFEKTAAYTWLLANAHRYGFVLSYPEGNAYYIFEPWHWRYVGVELATSIHNEGQKFYDMEQRDIDAYLVKIFD